MRHCGRELSPDQLRCILRLIEEHPQASRARLSRLVCEQLDWRRPDGRLKDMSCRVAMLRMQEDGLLRLPPPRNRHHNGRPLRRRTAAGEPRPPLTAHAPRELEPLRIRPIEGLQESLLYNELLDRYHYLGYQPLPGAQIRYVVHASEQMVAILGFGAAAWKTRPRDQFIGWTASQRQDRLHLLVNNARFLLLPWVRCPNLASRILGLAARRLPADWLARYGYQPVLLETFVQWPRYRGTCYQAANWTFLGLTKGRGKLDVHNEARLPKKAIWVLPLRRDFHRLLCP
jgi:hypothetical protein